MKAEELRIGNLVYDTKGDVNVVCVETFVKFNYQIQPIPLTIERLIDWFGFWLLKKKSGTQGVYTNGKMNLVLSNGGNVYRVNQPVRYVHKLQNIYYSLYDEELMQNPKP